MKVIRLLLAPCFPWNSLGDYLPQQPILELPILTGEELYEAAMAKKPTAAGLDGWAWNEIKALSTFLVCRSGFSLEAD